MKIKKNLKIKYPLSISFFLFQFTLGQSFNFLPASFRPISQVWGQDHANDDSVASNTHNVMKNEESFKKYIEEQMVLFEQQGIHHENSKDFFAAVPEKVKAFHSQMSAQGKVINPYSLFQNDARKEQYKKMFTTYKELQAQPPLPQIKTNMSY